MNRPRKNQMQDVEQAKVVAREVAKPQRLTCEGCMGLRTYPRPMCQAENSPNFRQPREPYHARCDAFGVRLSVKAAAE